MKKLIIFVSVLVLTLLSFQSFALAHGGRTDGNGGHRDRSSGEYHYHHGYPAHQHPNGVCPYAFDDQTDHSSGIPKPTYILKTTPRPTPTPTQKPSPTPTITPKTTPVLILRNTPRPSLRPRPSATVTIKKSKSDDFSFDGIFLISAAVLFFFVFLFIVRNIIDRR